MALVQFCGAWLFPAIRGFGGGENIAMNKSGGLLLQYPLWLLIIWLTGLEMSRWSYLRLGTVLKPFGAFAAMGLFASVAGYDPASSLRVLFLWGAMSLCAGSVGLALDTDRAMRAIVYSFGIILLGSVLVAIVLPESGAQIDRGEVAWRGLFAQKNQLGWVASLGLLISLGFSKKNFRFIPLVIALLGALCILKSGSKGAVVVAMAGVGYRFMIPPVVARVSKPLAFVILMSMFILVAASSQILLPIVLEALGRDATLTGRTDIWAMYYDSMMRSPWIGSGPGAFTGLSPFTKVLADRLAAFGGILTPHNMYLGALGDSGFIGLAIFVGTLIYLVFIFPLLSATPVGFNCAGVGFLMMVVGFVETHEIYNAGVGGFTLVLMRAMAIKESMFSQPEVESTRD